VQCLEGKAVWEAAVSGRWSRALADAAIAGIDEVPDTPMEDECENPVLFFIEYSDGLKAASLMLNKYLTGWGYAATVSGETQGCAVLLSDNPHPHFSYLGLNIQKLFLTGQPTYPVERTLLVTGALAALMESRFLGHVRVETPHLGIAYGSYETMPIRPRGRRPSGGSLKEW